MQRMLIALVIASGCCAIPGRAQELPNQAPPPHDLGVRGHIEGLDIPHIPGAPFRGKLVVTLTNQWADGTTVRASFFNLVARDSQGRVHQERRTIEPVGSNRESKVTSISIFDTPARTRITCEVAEHICKKTNFVPQVRFWDEPEGLSRDGKSYLTREKKGTELLNAHAVERTLETRTTNAGAEGNDKPLVSTREFWYSPELKINLAVKRICACGSTQDLQLKELQLDEPEESLFQPPSGFTMVDLRKNPTPGY